MRDNKNIKKMILMGRSGAGKTTLTQVIQGEKIHYNKTQSVEYGNLVIDTPGEYSESHRLSKALALYTYEADVVGLLCAANEPYSLFPPGCAQQANREVIGIITKIDLPDADVTLAELWLSNAGCQKIFRVSSKTGEGIKEILDYLTTEESSR